MAILCSFHPSPILEQQVTIGCRYSSVLVLVGPAVSTDTNFAAVLLLTSKLGQHWNVYISGMVYRRFSSNSLD